jgi:hypothetical protein
MYLEADFLNDGALRVNSGIYKLYTMHTTVMVTRSVRDWRGVSMGRNAGRGSLPMAEQDEGFFLLILVYFISHPLIT